MRRTVHALAATLVAAATVTVTAGPASAHPAPPSQGIVTSPYVALGDSYSSAAGVVPFVPGSPVGCSRSLLNYAHDIARVTRPSSFTDVTCSGAKTSDFYTPQDLTPPDPRVRPQLSSVHKKTRLVTMTIGGNDEDVFVSSFFGCPTLTTKNPTGNPCEKAYGNTFTDLIQQQTYPNLVRVLTAVHKRAPDATVVILGYPEILPPTYTAGCAQMGLAMGDVPWLYHQQDVLNAAVAQAAKVTGSRFIDMKPSSTGHDACQLTPGKRWIEPLVDPQNAFPVHPNAVGEAAMARQTLLQLRLLQTSGAAS